MSYANNILSVFECSRTTKEKVCVNFVPSSFYFDSNLYILFFIFPLVLIHVSTIDSNS